ncbi:MAG TPA: hypothetical protein VG939_20630 [Caulobacteraceae bacterium]|nr:hypothetical protein [Caulobacteraceae bacterium]
MAERVEVGRVSTFAEAQVACSALRASGIDAVADEDPLAVGWREPYGQGGYRLFAPERDARAARALLAEADAAAPRPLTPPARPDRLGQLRLILVAALFAAVAIAAIVGRGLLR